MRRYAGWLAATLLVLAGGPCAAAPLEAYGKLPSIEDAQVSPNGKLLALILTDGDQRDLVVQDIASQKVISGVKAGEGKVRGVQWAGADHLLLTVTQTAYAEGGVIAPRSEWSMVVDYNLRTRRQQQLLENAPNGMNVVEGAPSVRTIKGKLYVFVEGVQFVGEQGVDSLFKVDLELGVTSLAAQASRETDQWLVDAAGEPFVQTLFDPGSGWWVLKLKRDGAWKEIEKAPAAIGHPYVVGLARDGRSALISATDGDHDITREVAPDGTDWGPATPAPEDQDFIWDPVTETPIGTHRLVQDAQSYVFYAPSDQTIWNATTKAFPGKSVSLVSLSQDHRTLVVTVDDPASGPGYYLVEIASGSASLIGLPYDGLKPDDIARVLPVAFTAQDGVALTGYLTLPNARDPKSLPLVVFPHGGPADRDEPGFDWWAQAMASRGYAVLQVNFRGSEGFGWNFLKAGFGQWGRKMQTDLSDGVRYLAARGTIDPKRVCIVGASYGGYAALAGAALDVGVYRCAVAVAGISDLKRFVSWAKNRTDVSTERYWDRFMGADSLSDPHLEEISPVDHVDAVKIPVLLIHGKDDTVVPFEQSQIMVDALQKAGKSAELVVLKHEDHWLSHGDTRLQMLQATMDFLQKNNPPG